MIDRHMCIGSQKLEDTGLFVQETGRVVATLHWKRVEDVIPGPRPAAIRLSVRCLSNGSRLVLGLILSPLSFSAIWAVASPTSDREPLLREDRTSFGSNNVQKDAFPPPRTVYDKVADVLR